MKRLSHLAGRAAVLAAGLVMAALLAIEPIEAHNRNALALSVGGCVVAERTLHVPFPCLAVDLSGAADHRYAVIRPPLARSEVLLVPTAPIVGIESPALLAKDTAPFFQAAWEARRFVVAALPRDPGWAGLGMAVNSRPSRSQDRLHIHVDCMQPSVMNALARYAPRIGERWTRFPVLLAGGHYWAREASVAEFAKLNPFAAVHDGVPVARRSMADMTLVIAGIQRAGGKPAFMLLAADTRARGSKWAVGEDLLDHSCRVASRG